MFRTGSAGKEKSGNGRKAAGGAKRKTVVFFSALFGFAAGYSALSLLISFDYPFISAAGGIAAAFFAPKAVLSALNARRERRVQREFCDMLNSMSGSFSSGRNLVGALADTEADMRRLYGADCGTLREVALIREGLRNGEDIASLLSDFASRSGLAEARTFAETVAACVRTGGDLGATVSYCREIITDRIRTEQQIAGMLASGRNEVRIMAVMPFAVSALTGGLWTAESSLRLAAGLSAGALFAAAYFLGRRIVNVTV